MIPRFSCAAALVLSAGLARAQSDDLPWWSIDGGGGRSTAGQVALFGTIGQPEGGGPSTGGPYTMHAGFWAIDAGGGAVTQADLSLALSDFPDPVFAGSGLTYTIAVTNHGPALSPGMTVTDRLPPSVSFVSASSGCTYAGATIACALGRLTPGGAATVTVEVLVLPAATGTIANSASVAGTAPDPAAANNSATASTSILSAHALTELAHGTVLAGDLAATGGVADADLYRIRQQPFSSYEVLLDAGSGDFGSTGPELERVANDSSTVLQAAVGVGAGPARSLRFRNDTAAPVDDEYIRVRSTACGSDCGPDDRYRLRTWDTTGAIPRFNNSATQVTVLILQNAGMAPLAGRVSFWSAAGTLLHQEPLALGPRASVVVNASTIGALQGRSGSITVAHDGPYGALTGKAVALEPATGFSFDSPLVSRPK